MLASGPQPIGVAVATVSDLLRVLHELMVKSASDQRRLLAHVAAVFGPSAATDLELVIRAEPGIRLDLLQVADGALRGELERIAWERGFDPEDCRALMARFFRALVGIDQIEIDGRGYSTAVLINWNVGQEASYHFIGLMVGDEQDVAATELIDYMDNRLRRFHKLVEMWELEIAWAREEAS